MVKAGADRPVDLLLYRQLTIKQDAEVTDSVGQFDDGHADFKSTVFQFQLTERGSRTAPDKLDLGALS